MKRKRIPHSIRKFIRKEKARIRREILDIKEQGKQINELYEKFLKSSKTKNPKVENKKQKPKPAELILPSAKTAIN